MPMTSNRQKAIGKYTLKNEYIEAVFTNVGAALTELIVADCCGEKRDVVLGYDDLNQYLDNTVYFGAVIGRFAGEIIPAEFVWNDKKTVLPTNTQGMHLHGGADAVSFKVWDVLQTKEDEISFSLVSTEKDSGYPEDVLFVVKYWLDGKALCAEYIASAAHSTPVNLTLHPYFNLNGHASGNAFHHELMIDADEYSITWGEGLEKGTKIGCKDTNHDFSVMRQIGNEAYDCSFILNKNAEYDAVLHSQESGITMKLKCTQPCLQLYNAGETHETGKHGAVYLPGSAICLEPQHFPNCVNIMGAEVPAADDKNSYKHTVRYEFEVK